MERFKFNFKYVGSELFIAKNENFSHFHAFLDKHCKTRMHSSRMHTARSSSRLLGGCACFDTPRLPLDVGLETNAKF